MLQDRLRQTFVLSLLFFIFAVLSFETKTFAKDFERTYLCPHVEIIGSPDPGFDEVEKQWVCGEPPNKKSPTSGAWARIPFSQAQYNLKNFLQKRGYHHPIFTKLEEDKFLVEIGPQSEVKRIFIEKDAGEIDFSKMRKIYGQPLSPRTLDQIESWVSEKLRNQGYACPKITSHADPDTGEVSVLVYAGLLQNITSVESEEIPDVTDGILRRYDAFEMGRPYDERLLTLTSTRIMNTGLLESAYFTHTCHPDGVHLKQEVIPGRARLLISGVGINTEGLILGRFAWKNTRLGQKASLLDISLSGSTKLQTLRGTGNWYFLPTVSRLFLNPTVQLNHNNEQHFEVISTEGQMGVATTLDRGPVGASFFLGPSLNFYRTLRGVGADAVHLTNLEARMNLKSHDFEFYATNPRTGYFLNFTGSFNHTGILSQVAAQRLSLTGEALWNVNSYDPPFLILGVRGGMTTILTNEPITEGTLLPAPYLQYLGGSMSLRGFGRQELPFGTGGGGLTSSFLGFELRLSQTLPYGIDPFLLFDIGSIGNKPISFQLPVYWNPGIGVRWASPVGSIRTTFAQGYSDSTRNHFQFYFSLGEEF